MTILKALSELKPLFPCMVEEILTDDSLTLSGCLGDVDLAKELSSEEEFTHEEYVMVCGLVRIIFNR